MLHSAQPLKPPACPWEPHLALCPACCPGPECMSHHMLMTACCACSWHAHASGLCTAWCLRASLQSRCRAGCRTPSLVSCSPALLSSGGQRPSPSRYEAPACSPFCYTPSSCAVPPAGRTGPDGRTVLHQSARPSCQGPTDQKCPLPTVAPVPRGTHHWPVLPACFESLEPS